jgi:hypothetical protein
VALRALILTAIAAGTIGGAAAFDQASPKGTVILASGETVAGLIVYQGETSVPTAARAFQVRTPDGRIRAIPLDEVAVVDFAGGRPTALELDSLGADTPHVMALRNGNSRSGRLVGVIGGEFVRWENPQGVPANVSIRNITRIYLNQERALELFEFSGGSRKTGWGAWLGRSGFLGRPEVMVDASVPWVDTGLTVQRGERLRFSATGGIKLSRMAGDTASPSGGAGSHHGRAPVSSAPPGAIIARIGDNGAAFAIVIGGSGAAMPATGKLWLGVNDDTLSNNSGSYRVLIER